MTTIKDDIKMREAIIGTTQVVYSLKEQGHNVLGTETIDYFDLEESNYDFGAPKGTKRIAVIYFD